MKLRMKLRTKLLLSVLLVAGLVFLVSIEYLTSKLENVILRNAYNYVDATTREYANKVKASFEDEMGMARSMSQVFTTYTKFTTREIKEQSKRIVGNIARSNPQFLSVWASWELSAIDSTWTKPHGRIVYTYYRENNRLKFITDLMNIEGEDTSSLYYKIKSLRSEVVTDPYWYTYTGSKRKILETSLCIPLIQDGIFAGLFGFDVALSRYQNILKSIKPYEGSYAMLLSQNGTIIAHTDSSLVGNSIDSVYSKQINLSLAERVGRGEDFALTISLNGHPYRASFSAFRMGKSNNHWTLAIVAPEEVIIKESKAIAARSRWVIAIGLVFLALIIWLISFSITRPLIRATRVLGQLAQGQIDTGSKITIHTGDEVEDIANSINILIDSLDRTTSFAKEIGKGNLSVSYNKLSDKDSLGEALLDMRKSLEQAQKIDKERKTEEAKIRWANEGVARFAEILRQNFENINDFTYDIIYNLVKYVGADIGAIYLTNSDDPNHIFYELTATYAYQRRKYEEKQIEYGEGLIGRCAKEHETIFMTDLPDNYIKIASGLGEESPTCLVIVPMKLNDEVYGVIEIAAFEEIEEYKVRFIEKIGESISATISNVRVNIQTAKLLEESKLKSEELAAQEEEMRQNMEELQATQEESARKSAEMESLINALHSSSYVIEYDLNGHIISVNQAYLALTGQTEKEIIGTHHADNIEMTDEQKKTYQQFWSDLKKGMVKKETTKITIGGKLYTFIETYSPIFDENHKVVKILKIAHNVTDFSDTSKSTKKAATKKKKKK